MKAWNTKTLALAIAGFAFAGASHASVVEHDYSQTGSPYPSATGELNLGQTPVTTGSFGAESTNSNPIVLSDGLTGTGNFTTDQGTVVCAIGNNSTVTYNFAIPITITELDTFTEWRDNGRINQDYSVYLSTDGTSFSPTPLATVAFDNPTGTTNTLVTLTDSTGTLATGVRAVKFSFPVTQNGYVGYTELAVVGTPEPASISLLAVAATSLLARRRRL